LTAVEAQFLPLATEHGLFGVVGIDLNRQETLMFEEETLLNTAVQQISTAIERGRLIEGKAANAQALASVHDPSPGGASPGTVDGTRRAGRCYRCAPGSSKSPSPSNRSSLRQQRRSVFPVR
jgi:hypothetical protein